MNMNEIPLLPPWADEPAVSRAADMIMADISAHLSIINQKVTSNAPQLISETEAYLRHIAEGW